MFYLFIIDVLILGYVGAHPPEGFLVPLGQIATFFYFASFAFLPFFSKWEETWLRKRGLPAEVEAMLSSEKIQLSDRRHKKKERRKNNTEASGSTHND